MRRIDLDANGRRRFKAVALGQRRPGLLRQFDHVGGQQFRLAIVDVELEVLALDFPVLAERVEQVERVLRPDVVRIASEGSLEVRPSGLDIPQPELVHAQQSVAPPGLWVDPHGLGREVPRLWIKPVVDAGVGEVVEQVGIARIVGEHAVAEGRKVLVATLQERGRSEQGLGGERTRVDLERLLRLFSRLREALGLKPETGPEHARRNQVRVDLQSGVQHALGSGVAVEAHRLRHREQRLRVTGIRPQYVLQRRTGLAAVVLLEEQLAEPDARHRPGRSERHRLVVGPQRVLEQFRIVSPQELASLAHGNEFLGRIGGAAVVGVDHAVEA